MQIPAALRIPIYNLNSNSLSSYGIQLQALEKIHRSFSLDNMR